jgi:hypothetical protein
VLLAILEQRGEDILEGLHAAGTRVLVTDEMESACPAIAAVEANDRVALD